jgi:hypothetical protein
MVGFFALCMLCHCAIDLTTVDKIVASIRGGSALDHDFEVGDIVPWSFRCLTRSADLPWRVS